MTFNYFYSVINARSIKMIRKYDWYMRSVFVYYVFKVSVNIFWRYEDVWNVLYGYYLR